MKVALLSHVDEAANAVDDHLAFHFAAGVDLVFLVGSTHPERANVYVTSTRGDAVRDAERTGAEWLLEGDVTEFWWPRGGSLKELLEPVSPRYDSVRAFAGDGERLAKRIGAGPGVASPVRGWCPIEIIRDPSDARVRGVLAALAQERTPKFPRPSTAEEAAYAAELAALREAEVAEARERLDALEERLAAVESGLGETAKRRLRALWRKP
jgi:hypothetical protein